MPVVYVIIGAASKNHNMHMWSSENYNILSNGTDSSSLGRHAKRDNIFMLNLLDNNNNTAMIMLHVIWDAFDDTMLCYLLSRPMFIVCPELFPFEDCADDSNNISLYTDEPLCASATIFAFMVVSTP